MLRRMIFRKFILCGALSFSALFSAGCHKQAPVVRAPLVLPARVPEPVATIPDPVPVPDTAAPPIESPVAINPALPAPPTPPPARPGPRAPRPVAVTPEPVAPAPTPMPAPSLGAILSADQKKSLDADYQADLREANKVLNAIRGHALSTSQTDSVNRAREFISQAAQYHDRDLATAAELARRARVLTQDLAGAH